MEPEMSGGKPFVKNEFEEQETQIGDERIAFKTGKTAIKELNVPDQAKESNKQNEK